MEWGEYLLTGDFVKSRAGRNLSEQEISYINRILDNGMYMLIVNSVRDDIKKSFQHFYDKSETATARDVLVYLKQKYAGMKVRGYAEFVGQYKIVLGKSIKDQAEWAEKCATYMLQYVQPREGDDITTSPEEKLAALLMFTFNPDKLKNLMSFIGKRDCVGLKEATELLKDATPMSHEIVLAANKSSKPPMKKAGTRGCYFCGGDHSIHQCKKMKDIHPDTYVYQAHKPKSADKRSDDPLFGACAMTASTVGKNNWIFDSGSSIHVCNNRAYFDNFTLSSNDEITGLVGKVTVKGYGTVVVGGFKLHNVADVPEAPFNLISISAATQFSGASFTMGKNWLTLTKENETVESVLASRINGLYVYHHDTLDSPVQESVAMLADVARSDDMLPQVSAKLDTAVLMHARLGILVSVLLIN